jgi:hypothetical protein
LLKFIGNHLVYDALNPLLIDVLSNIEAFLNPFFHSTFMFGHSLIDKGVIINVEFGGLTEKGTVLTLKACHEEIRYILTVRLYWDNVVW